MIVLDANILIRAVLGRHVRELIEYSAGHRFYTPNLAYPDTAEYLPTLLARQGKPDVDVNPRAPCGARRKQRVDVMSSYRVSIHAPRVGRDASVTALWLDVGVSIHAPRVGRDSRLPALTCYRRVSIHAPRVGRDQETQPRRVGLWRFNPRAPCGARLLPILQLTRLSPSFNPRAPCGARLAFSVL